MKHFSRICLALKAVAVLVLLAILCVRCRGEVVTVEPSGPKLAAGFFRGPTCQVLCSDQALARHTYALTLALQADVAQQQLGRPWPAGRPRVHVHPTIQPTAECTVALCDPADPRQTLHRIWVSGPADRIPVLLRRALDYCLLAQIRPERMRDPRGLGMFQVRSER